MDTIIERDSSASIAILVVGLVAVAVIGALALYFLRIYPFDAMAQQPGNSINIHLNGQVPSPVAPSSSDY